MVNKKYSKGGSMSNDDAAGCLAITLVVALAIVIWGMISLVGAFITMWAWNLVMPAVFGLSVITYWQALAVNLLVGLVKGIITIKNRA